MNKQEIEKAISLLKSDIGVLDNYLKKHPLVISHYLEKDRCIENQLIKDMEFTISVLEHQLTNGWIPVSERLPEPKEWCWVWFDYDEDGHSSGNGFCEKMYLSSNGKWMKNTLSTVKDEYMDCIRAWQPYFEPEPYKD